MDAGYDAPGDGASTPVRVLAPNPSPLTGPGTNSFLVGTSDLAVIDPGPDLPVHLDALHAAIAGRPVRAILVTHPHLDHSPAARPLSAATGAPVLAYGPPDAGRSAAMRRLSGLGGGEGVDTAFRPDHALADGETISGTGWTLVARHTPGHMGPHMAFVWPEARAAFTGDTVLGWTSTLISPPDGDLGQFLTSLDLLEDLDATTFHPGHGGAIADPAGRCRALRAHRLGREAATVAALPEAPRIPDLVARLYADVPAALHPAAARNVLAHLVHLAETGRAEAIPAPGPDAVWRLSGAG